MKILGIDSSGLVAGIAVVEDEVLLAEYNVNYKKTHSQTLLPMLDAVRNMLELDLDSIDAIAVASGPGSFTGLRIGSATAKGLGLALNKPIVEVPTLEGLAYNLCGVEALVCPLIDARRNQVYTGIYEFDQNGLRAVEPQCAVDVSYIINRINELGAKEPGRKVILLGDGVPVYRKQLEQEIRIPHTYATPANNRQRAASVAALGAVYFAAGRTVLAAEHRPEYLRQSQAERERTERTDEGTNGAERADAR
ncbi:MAG: tRNA (adenosine(37)-N6)-threonylcarbamoyltransferase complex dimerization subunit type 1 TsaB [Lachnospiraceae bacterium]|nr:tRNA (adenosine(37)-N6)-threonylcarbamoyltransferase complex dimerization subunit type 1 TsaB [Lachnospiraceae bacterium]